MAEEQLEGVLRDIARVAGRDAALLIAKEYGGARLYVPERMPRGHRIAQLVGHAAAEAIAGEIGGREVTVPLGPFASISERRRTQAKLEAEGATAKEIARRLGVVERTAYRNRARLKRGLKAPDLFSDE